MELLIYGAGNKGVLALDLIKNKYESNYQIKGFIDQNKCGECQGYPIFRLENIAEYKGIILIALWDFKVAQNVCQLLKERGYTKIFWFQDKRRILGYDNFLSEQCWDCEKWEKNMLSQVEMHVIDSCNLNCKGCSHFSPIFSDELPNLELRLADVEKLKEKLSYVMKFYILGGEPFLNPEIDKYICGIRRILPDTKLYIVTNGLLIDQLSCDVLQCIKDNRVWISISEYKPTHKRISDICKILEKHEILYEIRGFSLKENFCLPLSLNSYSKYPRTCISNQCVTIWNGKIARCPQLMYISYFNSYFGTNLPEEGVMSLEDCAEGEKLLQNLQKKVPLCNHCIKYDIEWSTCGKSARLEDFAVYD